MPIDPTDDLQTIGKCRVLSELGGGGMGVVYRCRHLDLDLDVAVKLLHPAMAEREDMVSRFLREARLAVRVNHSGVVRVLDCGEDQGRYYLVMEFVNGDTLQDRIDSLGTIPAQQALEITEAVARALGAAQAQVGIIHRDIKPDNIMLTPDGQVKVTDLGLAKVAVDQRSVGTNGLTMPGTIMGTPCYMAPEQCTEARSVDHRADIFSLGATLYHMLSGNRPFYSPGATVLAVMRRVLDFDPDPLAQSVPVEVRGLVSKMMAKGADERHQTYEELVAAIESVARTLQAPGAPAEQGGPEVTAHGRRLPVYLLLDCSESMAGSAIEAVSQGVEALVGELQGNPMAVETAWISVITFSKEAKQVVPLTDLIEFSKPELKVRTGTALGAALLLLGRCIEKDVVKTTPEIKGDYKPFVFLLTDGQPTDDWRSVAADFRERVARKAANVYAIGCGPDADAEVLGGIADIVLLLKDLRPDSIRKLFFWLTASVQTASESVGMSVDSPSLDLGSLPKGTVEVAPAGGVASDGRPYQLFLHARCGKKGKPYLMRFARRPRGDRYVAITSHPLEELEDGDEKALPPVNTGMLDGCPPCPYCGNQGAAVCGCGALLCSSGSPDEVFRCPRCRQQGRLSKGGGTFDVRQVQG
jgi:uncharacterized protein YegL/predicted Ser/Thr protein kinase